MGLSNINSKKLGEIGIIVVILILPWTCANTQAQTSKAFEPTTKFSVPNYNGTINFAVNGTYYNATFQNNIWTFTDLQLEGSQLFKNFSVSAQDCNITIFIFQRLNPVFSSGAILVYGVEGKGNQVLNLGFGPERSGFSSSVDWSVILKDNTFAAPGEGWSISHDGTMNISGANGNVTVLYWGFLANAGQSSNLPFYEQHSVAIFAAVAVAATVMVTVAIKVNIRRSKDDVAKSN